MVADDYILPTCEVGAHVILVAATHHSKVAVYTCTHTNVCMASAVTIVRLCTTHGALRHAPRERLPGSALIKAAAGRRRCDVIIDPQ